MVYKGFTGLCSMESVMIIRHHPIIFDIYETKQYCEWRKFGLLDRALYKYFIIYLLLKQYFIYSQGQ